MDVCFSPRDRAIEDLHRATAVYTRGEVVERVLDLADWPRCGGRLLDTSCGDGAFLGASLTRLLDAPCDRPLSDNQLVAAIAGWELHPGAAATARARLADILRARGWAPTSAVVVADAMVRNGDFLTDAIGDERVDVVVGNPPYAIWARVPHALRNDYIRTVPQLARADLLHAFLHRARDALAPDGCLVLVVADRVLFNAGAAHLREDLGRSLRITHLERLDAASAFHRPKQRQFGKPARVHPVLLRLDANGASPSPRSTVAALTRAPIYPDAPGEIATAGPRLGDVADVRLAPWVGPHGIFVVDADRAAALPCGAAVPVVDVEDLVRGHNIELAPARAYAVMTRPGGVPSPTVLEHLAREMHRMPKRGRRAPQWWLPPEPTHVLDISREAIVVPRIATQLRPTRLLAGRLPVNHNLHVVASRDDVDLATIERFLRSEHAQAWIAARAPRLEGGYRSITTRLLRAIPWRDPAQ